jgi:hypothetical protein
MNKAVGLLIVALYFGNKSLCDYFFSDNITMYWYLNNSIISACMLLAIKYKSNNNFIEKLFNSMVANNIYVLLFKHETTYTFNDLWIVGIFFIAQYLVKKKKDE